MQQLVRVAGGWGKFQFAVLRISPLDEIKAAAPDKPASAPQQADYEESSCPFQ
jgi:hypothetical protein